MSIEQQKAHGVPQFWKTTYGVINSVADQNEVTLSLGTQGEWVESELDLLSSLLQEGATVVEVGGEYGVHALCFSRIVGELGQVHVFERDRLRHLQLCANVALNGVGNVYAYLAANQKRKVSLAELELDALHLVKVNSPGTLGSLLVESRELIKQHKPFVYSRLGSPQQAKEEVRALKALGYRCWSHVAYLQNPTKSESAEFPGWAHQNLVAAPIDSGVEMGFEHLREI